MKTKKQKMIAIVILTGIVLAVILWWGLTPVKTTKADDVCFATSSHSTQCIRPIYKPGWLVTWAMSLER